MKFDSTVSVGNLLTVGTVLASALTLVYTLVKDQRLRRHELADRTRTAAASTLAGLLRWREQISAFYTQVDPLFVAASEALVSGKDVASVKSELWKGLMVARGEAIRIRSAEKFEVAYTGLLAYDPRAYEWALQLVAQLQRVEESSFASFMTRSQKSLSEFASFMTRYQESLSKVCRGMTAPQVSNQLRADARWEVSIAQKEVLQLTKEAERFLVGLIEQSDRELICRQTPAPPATLVS